MSLLTEPSPIETRWRGEIQVVQTSTRRKHRPSVKAED